ncbi:hypothetical protein T07_7567 [Trichinella nelsoni]|uniref:Uncharacterized protein n=1 Tax=Trichinella nelsoni TaxID=6336 RepID=A0A0V0RNA2_9BILA|nr:hypothetical protein T07_7567 [Trichinella nelsoni]
MKPKEQSRLCDADYRQTDRQTDRQVQYSSHMRNDYALLFSLQKSIKFIQLSNLQVIIDNLQNHPKKFENQPLDEKQLLSMIHLKFSMRYEIVS